MGGLHAPCVAVPVNAKVGVAAVPCVRTGFNLFSVAVETSDQGVLQIVVAEFGAVVFHADVDSEALRQKNVRSNAVHVPGVPALSEALLHLLVLRGARRIGALIGSVSG